MESFCDSPICRPSSVRPSVNHFTSPLKLLIGFYQTSQQWSQGGPLYELFEPFKIVA